MSLCSEVTKFSLPQMQAKSEMAQPVAEMPAWVADDCEGGEKGYGVS